MSSSKTQADTTQTSDTAATTVSEEVSQVTTEALSPGIETVEGTDAASVLDQGQGQPSEAAIRFEDLLRQKGITVDEGTDPAELYESVISRALAGSQAMSEAARLRDELEQLRASQSQPAQSAAAPQDTTGHSQPTGPETQSQQIARRFRELQKYDPLLENYVERDDSGYAKPITSFGAVSIDAARTINEYERASREQADMLLRNPMAVVEDSKEIIEKIAEEKAQRIIEARFAEMNSRVEQERQSYVQAEQERQSRQSLQQWHEVNKSVLFHLDANGEPKQDFFGSGDVAWTKAGSTFKNKLSQLRTQLPGAPEITLRQLALEFATAGTQQAQAQAAVAEPAPVLTQAQQKRLLADNRQPVPNQQTPAADVGHVSKTLPTLRLANMVRMNPENAERVSGWRN